MHIKHKEKLWIWVLAKYNPRIRKEGGRFFLPPPGHFFTVASPGITFRKIVMCLLSHLDSPSSCRPADPD